MTCREFTDFIADYLAGELAPDALAAFERHLSRCDGCREYLAGYRETVALGRRACVDDEAAVPLSVPEDLVRAILAARHSAGR